MKIKKITSLLLSMSIIFGMVNIGTAFAAGNSWDISAAQDGSVTATYDEATKTMTWSGRDYTLDFSNLTDEVAEKLVDYFLTKNDIENVIIEYGVENIGNGAFSGCRKLTSIKMKDGGVRTIGMGAFNNCLSLTSIEIPNSVENIEDNTFEGCRNIDTFTWRAYPATFDSTSFNLMGSAVEGKKTAYIDGRNTELKAKLEELGYTIVDTYAGPWDVSEAQDGSVIATYDEATETLTVSGNGRMMDYGQRGDEYTYPPYSVRANEIKKAVFQGVQNVGAHAFNSSYLATVEIGNSVESIGEDAFVGCSNLSSVTMGKGLKSIGAHVFNSDTSLTSIELPAGLESIGGSAFQNCNYLTSISIPDSVKSIDPHAFAMCNSLPSIKLPDNLNSIGDYALQCCNKIDTFTWRAYPATIDTHTFGWGVNSYSGESTDMGSSVEGPKTAYIDARNTELKTKLESLGYTIVDSPIETTPDTPSTDLDASNQHPVDENGNGTTKIEITTEPLQMTVTVPVVLPVYFNVKGEATVASNARIVNKSAAPINVTAYNVEAQSGWTFVDTDHDFAKDKAGTKNFSLTVSDNVMDMIAGHDELPFQYDSKISGQKAALTDALIGNVVWIIDWAQ